MKTFIAAVLLAAPLALAQSTDVEQLWLDPAGRGSLFVGNGRTLQQTEFRVGVSAFYTRGNLRSSGDAMAADLLQDRFGFQLFGALGLFNWLELGANVPVFVFQNGASSLNLAQAGLGNPWLQAKVSLLDANADLSMAIVLGVGIPVGTAAAQGNGGLGFHPRVQVGHVFDKWQLGAELGYLHRADVDFSPLTGTRADRAGPQVSLAMMAATVSEHGPRGEITVRGFVPTTGAPVGVEAMLGFRWQLGPVELIASAGPGFAGEPTTPAVRAYLGAAFGNVKLTEPTCSEGRAYKLSACPALDRDGDGVANGVDRAPLEPEDRDGFQDEDGAPDLDNDGDGTPDQGDRCPDVSGPAENNGCLDEDADGDGVVNRLDRCADVAEDRDDFEDGDGCPEPDNDADGFADANDACPRQAGIAQEKGCPAKDSDQDGVFDHLDNCPQESGVAGNAGCAEAKKQLVVLEATGLRVTEPVRFEGKSVAKKSLAVLDNVAAVMTAHPEIRVLIVEAPSKEQGEAVKAYLVKKGVDAARLELSERPDVGFRFGAN